MLVLGRKLGESIVFVLGGLTVEVTLKQIRSANHVRLGIIAPENVRVIRKELLDSEREKNK